MQKDNEEPLVHSYMDLRQIIGYVGTSLPFILYLGALVIFQVGMQDSVSGYYYTGMRDVFVGAIWTAGFFLLAYQGYERADAITGRLAFVFAIGLTLFPVAPGTNPSPQAEFIGNLHLVFAGLFFACLTYFSLFLFTKTSPAKQPTKRKLQRNVVYRICGFVMAICVLLLLVYNMLVKTGIAPSSSPYHPIFWLEAIAILAFGISWLTKGQAILKDDDTQVH